MLSEPCEFLTRTDARVERPLPRINRLPCLADIPAPTMAQGWNVCADYPAIKAYMTRVRSRPSWQACLYSDMIVEAEWTKALNL